MMDFEYRQLTTLGTIIGRWSRKEISSEQALQEIDSAIGNGKIVEDDRVGRTKRYIANREEYVIQTHDGIDEVVEPRSNRLPGQPIDFFTNGRLYRVPEDIPAKLVNSKGKAVGESFPLRDCQKDEGGYPTVDVLWPKSRDMWVRGRRVSP